MMKNYIAPEMEIVKFSAEDIITASTGDTPVVPSEITKGGTEENGYTHVVGSGTYYEF